MQVSGLMKIMGAIGAIWLLVILFSAARTPTTQSVSVEAAMARFAAFEMAFPPRPLPPMTAQAHSPTDGEMGAGAPQRDRVSLSDLSGPLILVHFLPARCATCPAPGPVMADLSARFSDGQLSLVVIALDGRADGADLPPGVVHLRDTSQQFAAYARPRAGHPLTVLYRQGHGEIGRTEHIAPWGTAPGLALLATLLTDLD